jgi:hypothetical protein
VPELMYFIQISIIGNKKLEINKNREENDTEIKEPPFLEN